MRLADQIFLMDKGELIPVGTSTFASATSGHKERLA
jgi:hypothetical protein